MKHREAARLKREREGDWLGEREAERERERDRVIREAVRLVKEREVNRLERARAARKRVVERLEREREREVEREREIERLERERERELERLERERAARKREVERSERFPLCCDCSGLVPFTMPCLLRILSSHHIYPNVALHAGLPFTMPCLLRILSSHHIYPQCGTTCRPTKYLTLFLVGFSAVAVGGEQEMEVMEKRKARKECDETRASRFIRCLLFVYFQEPFLFKVCEATLFCE